MHRKISWPVRPLPSPFSRAGPRSGASDGRRGVCQDLQRSRRRKPWRAILSPEQYNILREQGTERAGTSPLNDEKRKGMFHCVGCDLPVYSSETKYESGTGWRASGKRPGAVSTHEDTSHFMVRTNATAVAAISAIYSTTVRRQRQAPLHQQAFAELQARDGLI